MSENCKDALYSFVSSASDHGPVLTPVSSPVARRRGRVGAE